MKKYSYGILGAYFVLYLSLRSHHVLVLRNYLVVCPGGSIEFVDIDHGSAFTNGKLRPRTVWSLVFWPLMNAEIQVRGYGKYPQFMPDVDLHENCGGCDECGRGASRDDDG